MTDANGYFTVAGLPPGTYDARASLAGFGTVTERLVLVVAQEAALSLTLKARCGGGNHHRARHLAAR